MEMGTLEKKIAELPNSFKLKLEVYVDALLNEAKGALIVDGTKESEKSVIRKTNIEVISNDF